VAALALRGFVREQQDASDGVAWYEGQTGKEAEILPHCIGRTSVAPLTFVPPRALLPTGRARFDEGRFLGFLGKPEGVPKCTG